MRRSPRNLHSTVTAQERPREHRPGTIASMKHNSFLGTAETRAEHLRELSQHIRSLEWTNASLREVEHEIPELELAMAVYRRLNAEGSDTSEVETAGAKAFLSIAEARAVHLRQISHHMHSLEWVHASLTEVENEIPELELAMAVYRRLTGETDDSTTRPTTAPAATAKPRSEAREDDAPGPPPSFAQFAVTHLDPAGSENAGADRPLETVSRITVKADDKWMIRKPKRSSDQMVTFSDGVDVECCPTGTARRSQWPCTGASTPREAIRPTVMLLGHRPS